MKLEQRLITNGVIQLVPLQTRHQDLFVTLYSNEKIMRQIAEPLSPCVAQRTFAKAINNTGETRRHYYWVIQNTQGADSGIAALIMLPDNTAEVGVMLLPKFSRQGLPLQVGVCLFSYAFEFSSIERIVVMHKAGNLPLPPVLRELSMQCSVNEGELCSWYLPRHLWYEARTHAPYSDIKLTD
ncbi:MAG: GNAT family N-acetyltransferase [Gammaproteobacteria bacterium]|nr:GNAT family N-acetyltransferase [Gammaproteobacteria bacterium]MBU2058974.1 GNAT family N-acetyltransferase [Gammaproteobacteria bacterium]MBU2175037.1 GNAT family N-acetyltransferase [Gammaproteobacteria bacterium]MBU2246720.1 GNAT family N-acetyltransferase [Gammaproteobacteria bacterium]MBU2345906.1 GNAT family N-acetyltransferase [Gammaproteobacteria bacterium]